jgi:hypothetical protein
MHYNKFDVAVLSKIPKGSSEREEGTSRLCGRVCSQVSSVDIQGMTCKYHPCEVL